MRNRPNLPIILLSCIISVGLLGYAHHRPSVTTTDATTPAPTPQKYIHTIPRPTATFISVPYAHHFKHLYRT